MQGFVFDGHREEVCPAGSQVNLVFSFDRIYDQLLNHLFSRNLYEMTPLEGDELGIPGEGKLVLIGKGLNATVRASSTLR